MKPVRVTFGKGNYRQNIKVGAHRLSSDASPEQGGQDSGPLPGEYLAAALGTCMGMTLRGYARMRSWVLDDVDIEIVMKKDMLTEFHCSIRLVGALSAEQRARLFELAKRCPIHRVLTRGAKIESTLIEEQVKTAPRTSRKSA